MKAALIATGSELVSGRVHEGNNYFLSQHLQAVGLPVVLHYVAGDDIQILRCAIEHALQLADIVIISGGLGPTVDDITFETLAQMFELKPVIHQPSKERMEYFFKAIGKSVLQTDFKMVTVPDGAMVFSNDVGLAPGFAITYNAKVIIALPGVPRELHSMVGKVVDFLKSKYQLKQKQSVTFKVVMMREAEVDSTINAIIATHKNIDVSITYEAGVTTVMLGARENDLPVDIIVDKAKKLFGSKLLYGYNSLEEKIVKIFSKHGKTIAIAESCTGGLIAKRITDIPGSSSVFLGGIVAYSNQVKISQLDVSSSTLQKFGAVSQQTALEMAEGVKEKFDADFGISTTGIAGPDGGSKDKPVGLVCFGIAGDTTFTTQIQFAGSREQIRTMATNYILTKLLSFAGLE
ncbi:MAG: CinA family nicotinamide mononucleotide deamidase-related protein [Spirochaetes bacterium]|nr:CinA family nicotinamide mononucleotide deamidase-related protein [Spirochaetota bacterium]